MNEEAVQNGEETSQDREDLVVRKSFRVPVEDNSIQVVLNNITYPVSDISPQGISIAIKDNTAFTVAQELINCELILPDETITGLTATVMHFTNTGEGVWQNGIQWVGLKDEEVQKIAAVVSKMKKRLLQDQG